MHKANKVVAEEPILWTGKRKQTFEIYYIIKAKEKKQQTKHKKAGER